jgi:hypothetical protein
MRCYKFRDTVDGNFIFVIDVSAKNALARAKQYTSIDLELVDSKPIECLAGLVVFNNTCPF